MCAIVLLVNNQTTRSLSDLFIYSNTCLKIISFCSYGSVGLPQIKSLRSFRSVSCAQYCYVSLSRYCYVSLAQYCYVSCAQYCYMSLSQYCYVSLGQYCYVSCAQYCYVSLNFPCCDCEIQNSNKSVVPLLEFMFKCNVERYIMSIYIHIFLCNCLPLRFSRTFI